MADSVSTLRLDVQTQTALQHLNEFGLAAANLGATTDVLRGKLLQLNARFLSMDMGRSLLADAAFNQEALGKYEQVLGRYRSVADKEIKRLRASFNFDEAGAQQKFASMVDVFTKTGIALGDAVKYTSDLMERASDLEAFTNAAGGLDEVMGALQSGMIGNALPLKKLGIVLNESTLKAQMAEDRMNGLRFSSDEAAKKQARYTVIMKQSAIAQGQVARESENYANKQRKVRAIMGDLTGELGEALIPLASKFADVSAKVLSALEKSTPTTKRIIVAIGAATGALVTLGPILGKILVDYRTMTATQQLAAAATAKTALTTQSETASEVANAAASEATAAVKNMEAAARARNATAIAAENAALKSQSASNLVSSATSRGVGTRFQAPLSKAEKRAAKIAWRAETEGARKFQALPSLDAPVAGGGLKERLLAKRAAGKLGGSVATASLGKAPGQFATLGKAAGKLAQPLGKVNGLFTNMGKFVGGLGKNLLTSLPLVGNVGKMIGSLGSKIPILGTLGGVGAKFLGGLIPVVGWAGTAVAVLKGLKNAPEWTEKIIQEILPKVKDFLSALPGQIAVGLSNVTKKIAAWGKEITTGALLGLGQTIKRLFGGETEASRAYKLNKRLEEVNAARAKLIEQEEAQAQAEKAAIDALKDARQSQLTADARYAMSKNSDLGKLAAARDQRDQTKATLDSKNNRLRSLAEETTMIGVQQRKLQKRASAGENVDNELEQLNTRRQEIAEESKRLTEEIGQLSETYEEQRESVDQLSAVIDDQNKAFKENQERVKKIGEENRKNLEAEARQAALDEAKTHADRMKALQADLKAKQEAVKEAESASAKIEEIEARRKELNGALYGDKTEKALAILNNLAQSGATDETAQTSYDAAILNLRDAGYDVDSFSPTLGSGSAARLLESVNDQAKAKAAEDEKLLEQENEQIALSGELASRKQEARGAQSALDAQRKSWFDARQKDDDEAEARRKERESAEKNRQKAFNEEAFSRNLTMLDDSVDSRDPWSAYNVAGQKYDLIAGKASAEWSESQKNLDAKSAEMDALKSQIEALRQKELSGTATDEEIQERQAKQQKLDDLQSEYDSESESALQKRWAAEKELYALQKDMQSEEEKIYDERDKQIRDYVGEQGDAMRRQLEVFQEEAQKRLEEENEVAKEQRKAIEGSRAITAGSSEAFQIQSRIYDRGGAFATEKRIEKSTEKIEKYVSQLQEQLYQYLSGNNPITISMGY